MDSTRQHLALERLHAIRRFANEDIHPCKVLDGLYVGSMGAARNLKGLQAEGVTHVLNCSPVVPCFHKRHLHYKTLHVYDDEDEDIASFFEEANRFIAKGRRKGAVLVHCYAGQSRSISFTLAYLCRHERMALDAALLLVRVARGAACPNRGFLRQLTHYAQGNCKQRDGLPPCEDS